MLGSNTFYRFKPIKRLLAIALVVLCSLAPLLVGCMVGPASLARSRLQYNEAIKVTSEQQLLLNVVRLRYIDTPSSLSISNIAEQRELMASLQAMPFFTSAAAGNIGSFHSRILPQAEFSGANRPTLSYTPIDDEEFTRKLFTPLTLDGVTYLAKTTWPISTVFRLYLENMNWVSNAENGSGPTPEQPPEYFEFLEGINALQRLQDRKLITLYHEERTTPMSPEFAIQGDHLSLAVEANKQGLEVETHTEAALGPVSTTARLIKKKRIPILRVANLDSNDEDWMTFCTQFHLDATQRTFTITTDELDPYFSKTNSNGLVQLDLETRSLLQVLFFVSQGVDVPAEHLTCGIAPSTRSYGGLPFDWDQVLGGLIKIHSTKSKKMPECAQVAVRYRDYWFYIDRRDQHSKSTFSLLLELSRLQVQNDDSKTPLLTIPLGRS